MSDLSLRIAANLDGRSRIAWLVPPSEPDARSDAVQLVAVTKYARLEWVQALVSLGQLHLGESRPQQLIERAESSQPARLAISHAGI